MIAQLLNVEAHQTILNIHIGSVVKQFQRTLNIDFQGGRYTVSYTHLDVYKRQLYRRSCRLQSQAESLRQGGKAG